MNTVSETKKWLDDVVIKIMYFEEPSSKIQIFRFFRHVFEKFETFLMSSAD